MSTLLTRSAYHIANNRPWWSTQRNFLLAFTTSIVSDSVSVTAVATVVASVSLAATAVVAV